ncbi:MAG: 50S ribosomal protein L5 [Nanoarchaeota archaeon]
MAEEKKAEAQKAQEKKEAGSKASDNSQNPMRTVRISKLTLHIGAGTDHAMMDKGVELLEMITGIAPVKTRAVKRIPTWGLRPGLPIGCKITLRGKKASEVLERLLKARDDLLPESCFDNNGNISFGIKEYIDIPGVEYNQKIGIIGLQVSVTLERPGYRIQRRHLRTRKIHHNHKVTKEDAISFARESLKIQVE